MNRITPIISVGALVLSTATIALPGVSAAGAPTTIDETPPKRVTRGHRNAARSAGVRPAPIIV